MFEKFFKKKKGIDPLKDLTLAKLKVGYLVDYDMRTWEVTGYNRYDWGGGDYSEEWELKSGSDTRYLEKEEDDEIEWCLTKKVFIEAIDPALPEIIIKHEDPPKEIIYNGERYYMESTGAGYFLKDGKGLGEEFIRWDYLDETGKKVISIEQWGEEDFEAAVGEMVEEYQFTNILPRE